jgi:glycine cleavage system T protein (aminomethyltransferase)
MSNLCGVSDTAEKTTPLYQEHVKCGAKLIPFGGWLMPVQYSGIVDEHRAVRKDAGVFDISHMGQFVVAGEEAGRWLNRMLTNNVEKLEVGQGQYTFLLNEKGGIIDDLIAYRIAPEDFLLVVNAARSDEDLAWLQQRLPTGLSLTNRSADHAGLALQGPRVVELFHSFFGPEAAPPERNHIADFDYKGVPLAIARTGYTGEDGFEWFFPARDAVFIWNEVLQKGAPFGLKPCGLGARDTLRLEMCYPLNGSDLSPEHNPIEAGLGFFVDLQKGEFIGREKLARDKEHGPTRKLVPFRMTGKGPPARPHYAVYQNGERIGEVTSGTLSPSLNYGIGMAYLPAARAKIGAPLEIEIRERKFPAVIEKKPFYKKS